MNPGWIIVALIVGFALGGSMAIVGVVAFAHAIDATPVYQDGYANGYEDAMSEMKEPLDFAQQN